MSLPVTAGEEGHRTAVLWVAAAEPEQKVGEEGNSDGIEEEEGGPQRHHGLVPGAHPPSRFPDHDAVVRCEHRNAFHPRCAKDLQADARDANVHQRQDPQHASAAVGPKVHDLAPPPRPAGGVVRRVGHEDAQGDDRSHEVGVIEVCPALDASWRRELGGYVGVVEDPERQRDSWGPREPVVVDPPHDLAVGQKDVHPHHGVRIGGLVAGAVGAAEDHGDQEDEGGEGEERDQVGRDHGAPSARVAPLVVGLQAQRAGRPAVPHLTGVLPKGLPFFARSRLWAPVERPGVIQRSPPPGLG
mmetsp:Transcript_8372/g.28713  ORF Transcript_8372/g.28713 Transcript_8372/m.28713 type:complete len:300 (+) Transcript_8372:422-1321(+)